MGGSMRIESARLQNQSEGLVNVKLYIEGRNPVYAYADSVAQAIVRLAKNPGLPSHVLEWLVPRGAVFDEPHGLSRLRQDNAELRAAAEVAKCEAGELRRMVDLLLDRLEGRRR